MATHLVTGGAGFIGSSIAEKLLASGETVRVIDDFSTGRRSNLEGMTGELEIIEGSICDPEVVKRAMYGVEVVFHQAAIPSVSRSIENPAASMLVNVQGTTIVLESARQAGVRRIVYAASSSAYGNTPTLPKVETMPASPLSPYAVAKFAGEQLMRVYAHVHKMETVSLRYFNVFGPRQDPESLYSAVVPKFMEQAYLGKPLEMHWDGKQSRDFTHIDNVVQANLLAAVTKKGIGETFNIANGKTYSLLDMLRVIEGIVGHKLEVIHHPKRAGDVRKTFADISQARKKLGYKPSMNFDNGLKDTWDYFVNRYFKAKHPVHV
jgi:UDP-glucose 4-epimerase